MDLLEAKLENNGKAMTAVYFNVTGSKGGRGTQVSPATKRPLNRLSEDVYKRQIESCRGR